MVPVIEVVKLSYNSTALGKKDNKGNTIKVFGPWEYSTNQIPGLLCRLLVVGPVLISLTLVLHACVLRSRCPG